MTPPRPICGIGLALSNHLAFYCGLLLAFFGSDHTVTARPEQAIVLVRLWAVAVSGVASLHAPGAANKNFIGIVEVNNELPINPRPICGSTRLAFPGSFILALAQFVKPVPALPPLLCWCGAQRAKFARKVHKPPLGVNVINFELNGFNVYSYGSLESLRVQSIQVYKICGKQQDAFLR
jgi:hypothetical protein